MCMSDVALHINIPFLEFNSGSPKPSNRNSVDWLSGWTFASLVNDKGTGSPFWIGPEFRSDGVCCDDLEFGTSLDCGSDILGFRRFWCFFILMPSVHIQYSIANFLSETDHGFDELQWRSHLFQPWMIMNRNHNHNQPIITKSLGRAVISSLSRDSFVRPPTALYIKSQT